MRGYRIGAFELDLDKSELRRNGNRVALEPKAFLVLTYLVENCRRTVPQDELVEQVWPGRIISSDALYRTIKLARLAFRDGGIDESIKTVHRVGYRFVAPVENLVSGAIRQRLVPVLVIAGRSAEIESPPDATEVSRTADSIALTFQTSADALRFALAQCRDQGSRPVSAGLHIAVANVDSNEDLSPATRLAAALAALSAPGRVLLSATAYELCRAYSDLADGASLRWVAHGAYRFADGDDTLMVFEVAQANAGSLGAPPDGEVAVRVTGDDAILGWRAAAGQSIPSRPHWLLRSCLGSGGFGEAWLAEHDRTREKRVFKFCYRGDRLRSLQREVTLFRLLRETLGTRDDIARILDWNFTDPPYFIESEFTSAGDLAQWTSMQGGAFHVALETRIELVVGIARALAAAHAVGVLHKDVKPSNVLVDVRDDQRPRAVLADFGIGTLTDPDPLAAAGITALGMTEALKGNLTSSRSGTRRYQAPEVIEGKPATIQADIYSLGVVAYQLVVGDLERVLAPGWERDVQDELISSDIAAMVDRDPSRRPVDANQIAEQWSSLDDRRCRIQREQEAAERMERDRRRRRWLVPAAAAAVVFAAAMAWQNARVTAALETAEREAATARQTAEVLSDLFDAANPLMRGGQPPTLETFLAQGERRIREEADIRPAVRAQLLTTVGARIRRTGRKSASRRIARDGDRRR